MKLREMTDSELLIMKVIWDKKGEITMPEVLGIVNEKYQKDWKPQTVSTFMARLVQKGYLQMKRSGRTYTYQILIAEEDYLKETVEQFVDFWGGNSFQMLASALCEKKKASPEEMNKLKGMLDELD